MLEDAVSIWQYEICDIANGQGREDADALLKEGWEPFSATEGGYIGDRITTINLWLRKRFSLEELVEEE